MALLPSGRRWQDVQDAGGVPLPDRLRDIEARLARQEARIGWLLIVLTIDTILTGADIVARVPGIARLIGG